MKLSKAQVDEVRIEWPVGQQTILVDVQAGQFISADHPDLL